ncbi:MAG: hypothetical protein LH472_02115, partial [Pyrinomonadaceae bacterium]|nr:hypothetical protein [Pyrinomonadaceae bacterium]
PTRPLASKIGEPAIAGNKIYDALFPAMTYQSFGISTGGDKPSLSLASEFVGSAQITEPSTIQFYGAGKHVLGSTATEINETPINRGGGLVTIYPEIEFAGTAVTTECLIKDFSLTINENVTLNYDCILFQDGNKALGQIAGDAQSSGQTVSLEFTMIADSDVLTAFAVNTRLKAGTEFSMINSFTGPIISGINAHQADFRLSRAAIASVEWTDVEGGGQGLRVTTEPLAVGNSMPLSLWLTTNVANFNTYVGA